jgi:polyribonucleotide nucleotidyltransferase
MASVCAGSMALMDAGVGIETHAAGVAMGLFKNPKSDLSKEDEYLVMTDILGLEDYLGEMDFKIAGTEKGFTALQLDVKSPEGIPSKVIMEALQKGHVAKGKIITLMNEAIREPKKHKETWPVNKKLEIPVHKRSRFLGLGGIHLKRLTSETGVQVTEVLDSPNFYNLFAPNEQAMREADDFIAKVMAEEDAVPELEFGAVYDAKIIEIRENGVLVTLDPKMQPTLLHNKELDQRKIGHPSALGLEVGQILSVKFFGRDPVSGHLRISRRVLQMTNPKVVKQSITNGNSE